MVLGVIKPLRQRRTDMSHSLDRCVFFFCFFYPRSRALLAVPRRHPGLLVGFPTRARAVTQDTTAIIQQASLRQCCNRFGSDCFPALVSDAIRAETSQSCGGPGCTHMKLISSTLVSRVLRDCMSSLSPPPQTPVIATTFSHRAAVCVPLQVCTSS